ncbi:glycosyltransferase family 9 protein [Actinomycetospora cinnamomea]|uniref:ADP-heptose:LPS heptosyltransferase n=1 Tax=Actinomycetospora cinnamomea TaxID=663609 RepID=A0A2U1F7U7_9PSEU|nr:glycosyltransferase family 9 protein [Actinomycetospora cinnamomea]PVZ08263.1 ADP-heptose:LPS heptosyltransferase [Actinomycetospora cinnamomea]
MTTPSPHAVVLRDLGLGDLLVAVPALRLLRRALPGHEIVLVAPAALAPLVARIEAVDRHVRDLSSYSSEDHARTDVAVNLHGRGPESHARLDALAPRRRIGHALPDAEGPDGDGPSWAGPPWTDDPARPERRRWCDLLAAAGLVDEATARDAADDLRLPGRRAAPAGPVVVHPGAAYGAKRWPPERFAVVTGALARQGHPVVVTGGDGERRLTAEVVVRAGLPPDADLGGRTDLAGLLDLVAAARLVLAGDTGISHVATALGTPSVTLFGPVPPSQWGPPPGGPHVVLGDAAARRGERFADDPDPALLAVTPDEVLAALAPLIPAVPA